MAQIKPSTKLFSLFIFLFMFSHLASAQNPVQQDTVSPVKKDTTITTKKSEEKKRNNAYIVYAGFNFNNLSIATDQYSSTSGIGWHLGAAYKRGGFFYWQVGARLNSARYDLVTAGSVPDTAGDKFTVNDIDIPITGGINCLSFISRIANLRLFVSAVPAFAIKVSDNNLGIEKSDINTFNFYGQAGLGVDVFFLVIEGGYNYGFSDLMKNDIKSKPGQIFINLGARF